MTLIIGGIEKVFEFQQTFPYIIVETSNYWVGIVFVSFALLFSFFGYVSELISKDDILTPTRKKLVGTWQVTSEAWKISTNKIFKGEIFSVCTIGIEDVGRKLTMRFHITESDVWENAIIPVEHISISFRNSPYQLLYFSEIDLEIKSPPKQQSPKVSFPFLGILKIPDDKEIHDLTGEWYDIDNTVYKTIASTPEVDGAAEMIEILQRGAITFRGSLKFHRIPPPDGN